MIHSYKYFKTAYSPTPNVVDYWVVSYLDDVEIFHCHSKSGTCEATQEWMNNVTLEDPHFWETNRDRSKRNMQANKIKLAKMRARFNHTGGLFTVNLLREKDISCARPLFYFQRLESTGTTACSGTFVSFFFFLHWIFNSPKNGPRRHGG